MSWGRLPSGHVPSEWPSSRARLDGAEFARYGPRVSAEKERSDREGGRQVAWLTLGLGALVSGLGGWAMSTGATWEPLAWGLGITAVGGAAFAFPVFAIRLVMGRWAELFERGAEAPSRNRADRGGALDEVADPRQSSPLKSVQEGMPIEGALLEHVVPDKRKRAWIGYGLMALGTGGCVLSMLLQVERDLWMLAFGTGMLGLVLWYRTL